MPSTEVTLRRLAAKISDEITAAEDDFQSAVEHAIRAGELLIKAKATVKHGEWIPWLKEHCSVSRFEAANYMKLARNVEHVQHLPSIRQALKELAPSKDEPEVELDEEEEEHRERNRKATYKRMDGDEPPPSSNGRQKMSPKEVRRELHRMESETEEHEEAEPGLGLSEIFLEISGWMDIGTRTVWPTMRGDYLEELEDRELDRLEEQVEDMEKILSNLKAALRRVRT